MPLDPSTIGVTWQAALPTIRFLKRPHVTASSIGNRYDQSLPNVESAEKYAAEIFAVYPWQLPFHFEFKMAGSANKPYRVLLFITKVDGFSIASLVGNRTTIVGVPMPKDWPENPWTFWNSVT